MFVSETLCGLNDYSLWWSLWDQEALPKVFITIGGWWLPRNWQLGVPGCSADPTIWSLHWHIAMGHHNWMVWHWYCDHDFIQLTCYALTWPYGLNQVDLWLATWPRWVREPYVFAQVNQTSLLYQMWSMIRRGPYIEMSKKCYHMMHLPLWVNLSPSPITVTPICTKICSWDDPSMVFCTCSIRCQWIGIFRNSQQLKLQLMDLNLLQHGHALVRLLTCRQHFIISVYPSALSITSECAKTCSAHDKYEIRS